MRPLYLLPLLLTWISFGLAQESGLTSVITHIPTCAQSCLFTAIQSSPCEITDLKCVCANAKLQSEVEGCVLQSCTLRQSLATKNLTSTLCQAPIRAKGNPIRISNIILFVVTAACALTRVGYHATFSVGGLGWDDYSVLAALIVGVPSVIIIDRGLIPNGFGQDVWTVPFDHITEFVRYLYALEILYFLQIAIIKLTLLFFFLRIFPKPRIRYLLWATVTFNVLWGTAFVITAIFQCQPVSFYWTSWDKEQAGKCVNINALAWTNAIINIVLDIWMLGLPLYEVFQLQLSWRKKISVALMFFVGTFVTVVSALRLSSLVHFATSDNPTWDQTDVINWSIIEMNVGQICACLPALRVILVQLFPSMLGTTKSTSQPQHTKYGSRSHGTGGPSALRSGHGKHQSIGPDGLNTITYTKTFAVQHGDNDETSLVQMNDLGKTTSKVQSSNTSIVSL